VEQGQERTARKGQAHCGGCLNPASCARGTPAGDVQAPSSSARVEIFGGRRRNDVRRWRVFGTLDIYWGEARVRIKTPNGEEGPEHRGVTRCARLNPESCARRTRAKEFLSPSSRARVGTFRSAAATDNESSRDDVTAQILIFILDIYFGRGCE